MSKEAFVYFMASPNNTTLYVGVTSNLLRRVVEHKSRKTPGFTAKYHCTKLVYFEMTDHMISAIAREKQLKNWKREWKNELIAKNNLNWRDLAPEIGVTDALLQEIAGQARNDAGGEA
jgi:putative endonuclease